MIRRSISILITAIGLLLMACQSKGSTQMPPTNVPTDVPSPTPPSERVADADVLHVRAVQASSGKWTFHVTVRHPDTGWQDYADGWDVVAPDGAALRPDPSGPFTRLLLHPHETEQPFTRSQSRIVIPEGVEHAAHIGRPFVGFSPAGELASEGYGHLVLQVPF